jgi:ABC-type polysaccharide/polyol phosphate export permease
MTSAEIAPVAQPSAIVAVWRDLMNSRELMTQLMMRDLRLRYKQAVFGFAWAVLMPVILIAAGLIIRMAAFKNAEPGTAPSIAAIALKGWAWAFFAGGMNFATISVLSNVQLVTKIYFPREVLPIASVLTQGVDAMVGALILLILSPWLHFAVTPALLWLPVLAVLLFSFTLALGMLFACANLFFRDVKYILQVLLTFGVLFTPVLFNLGNWGNKGRIALLINPLSAILEAFQVAAVQGTSLLHTVPATDGGVPLWSPLYLLYALAWTALLFPISVTLFRRSSAQFAEFY